MKIWIQAFFILAFFSLASALTLLLGTPSNLRLVVGSPQLPATVHLVTLGFGLSVAYGLFYFFVPVLFRQELFWKKGTPLVLAFHLLGVIGMVVGFLKAEVNILYWGGHYFVPTALVCFLVQFFVTFKRAGKGLVRRYWKMPALGVTATIFVGAMVVLDRLKGNYGIDHPGAYVPHLLLGGFLFFVPLMLLPVYAEAFATGPEKLPPQFFTLWHGSFLGAFLVYWGWNFGPGWILEFGWVAFMLVILGVIRLELKLKEFDPVFGVLEKFRVLGWLLLAGLVLGKLLGTSLPGDRLLVAGVTLFLLVQVVPVLGYFVRRVGQSFSGREVSGKTAAKAYLSLAFWGLILGISALTSFKQGLLFGTVFYLLAVFLQLRAYVQAFRGQAEDLPLIPPKNAEQEQEISKG